MISGKVMEEAVNDMKAMVRFPPPHPRKIRRVTRT